MLLHPSVFRLRSDGVAFIFPHTITDPSLPRFTLYRCRPNTYAKRHAIILDYKKYDTGSKLDATHTRSSLVSQMSLYRQHPCQNQQKRRDTKLDDAQKEIRSEE